jgi:hypothetical protein
VDVATKEAGRAMELSTVQATRGAYLQRRRPSGLADVIDVILDKGLVVDAFVRGRWSGSSCRRKRAARRQRGRSTRT